ncbi:MAG: TetR/AcrR family transcriptional regulator [Chthoniobacterales bacterium]
MNSSSESDKQVIERILSTARQHFFRHGFRGVTMSDLAAEVGVSKKTLYVHFDSKRDLLLAVVNAKFASLTEDLENAADSKVGFETILHKMLTIIQKQAREVSPSFIRDLMRETPEIFENFRKRRQRLIADTFSELLRQGQKEKAVRRDVPIDFQVDILLAAVHGAATPQKVIELDASPGKLVHDILTIFLEGALIKKKGKRA